MHWREFTTAPLEMYEGTTLRVNWAIERPELCRLHKQRSSDLGHTRTIVSTRTRMTKLERATEIDADGLIGRKLDDHVGKFDNLSFDQFLSVHMVLLWNGHVLKSIVQGLEGVLTRRYNTSSQF